MQDQTVRSPTETKPIEGVNQDAASGLTSSEARERLARFGPNELTAAGRSNAAIQILLLFANPLVIILLLASLVSAVLREFVNAAIIATMVLLSMALNFFQTYRSERAASRLREQVAPPAVALPDGQWRSIPRR